MLSFALFYFNNLKQTLRAGKQQRRQQQPRPEAIKVVVERKG